MFWDNRGFAQVSADVQQEIKTPSLQDKNDANLFRAVTQEHVDMLARVRREMKDRTREDHRLYDEMYSFGVISVDPASESAKFFVVDVNVSGVAIPYKNSVGESKTLTVDMTRSIMLHKCNETADTVMVEGACYFVDGYSVNVCGYIQKRSGGVVLYLSLGGSAYINGAICIPNGRTDIATTIDHVHAYT